MVTVYLKINKTHLSNRIDDWFNSVPILVFIGLPNLYSSPIRKRAV
jgi:hypothetical protein